MSETDQRPLKNGEIIDNKYRIEKVLGSGGFGITYMATDLSLNRQVAIKEYFPQNAWREQHSRIIRTDAGKIFDTGLNRFHQEGQILAKFKHPNIVGVQTIVSANSTAYLVMDYENGETLDSYMNRLGRPLTYDEAEAIFNPLLDGLRSIHDHNLLHLDIKPENIFLCSNSTPVLIDFGGARHQLGQASRAVSFLVASDGFAPNEQYSGQGKQLQPNTDIYAVGATLYFCLTNQIPPDAVIRADAIANEQPDPLVPITQLVNTSEYPAHFLDAISAAINMRTIVRPQNVREFQSRLFQASHVVPPQPPSYQPESAHVPPPQSAYVSVSSPPTTNWTPAIVIIGIIILLLLGGVLWKISNQNNYPSFQPTVNTTDEEIRKLQKDNALAAAKLEAEKITQQAEQEAKRKLALAQEKLDNARYKAEQAAIEREKQASSCTDGHLTGSQIRKLVKGHIAVGTKITATPTYQWAEYQGSDGEALFQKEGQDEVKAGKWKVDGDSLCWCYGDCLEYSCKYVEAKNNCTVWFYIDPETKERVNRIDGWAKR